MKIKPLFASVLVFFAFSTSASAQASECPQIYNWSEEDTSSFTLLSETIQDIIIYNTPGYYSPGIYVTRLQFLLHASNPTWNFFFRIRSFPSYADAQSAFNEHNVPDPRVVYQGNGVLAHGYRTIDPYDDPDMITSIDLEGVYLGCTIYIEGIKRSNDGSGTLLAPVLQFCLDVLDQAKALIDARCAGPSVKLIPDPGQGYEFQLGILRKEGFALRIESPKGIDEIHWGRFKVLVAGQDRTTQFLSILMGIIHGPIGDVTAQSAQYLVQPDPDKFMGSQNLFGIQSNGEWAIVFELCDKRGACGRSEYSIYFGPFLTMNVVLAPDCADFRDAVSGKRTLLLDEAILGNTGHPVKADIYVGLTYPPNDFTSLQALQLKLKENASYVFYWSCQLLPFNDQPMALATGYHTVFRELPLPLMDCELDLNLELIPLAPGTHGLHTAVVEKEVMRYRMENKEILICLSHDPIWLPD